MDLLNYCTLNTTKNNITKIISITKWIFLMIDYYSISASLSFSIICSAVSYACYNPHIGLPQRRFSDSLQSPRSLGRSNLLESVRVDECSDHFSSRYYNYSREGEKEGQAWGREREGIFGTPSRL